MNIKPSKAKSSLEGCCVGSGLRHPRGPSKAKSSLEGRCVGSGLRHPKGP